MESLTIRGRWRYTMDADDRPGMASIGALAERGILRRRSGDPAVALGLLKTRKMPAASVGRLIWTQPRASTWSSEATAN